MNISHPLLDTIDIEILMHRDAHFGGNFSIMLDYYHQDGVGVMPDFELSRIQQLMQLEKELKENLSDHLLPESAKEAVESSKKLYLQLREVYETPNVQPISLLISDLILSEEETPTKEIEALVAKKQEASSSLISLVSASTFYDPLNPGYGRAPIFAADALSQLRDEKAIAPIFEALSYDNFYTDEAMISALVTLGEPSKNFLIKILSGKLIGKDTEVAAMVLASFPPQEEIAKVALNRLQDPTIFKKEHLASYLICACEGLFRDEDRDRFFELSKHPAISSILASEVIMIAKSWH
jgi:hypothetical protein